MDESSVERQNFRRHSLQKVDVAEFIFSDRFTTGNKINALSAHAQTLLSCLKQTALDRVGVRLNAILFKHVMNCI